MQEFSSISVSSYEAGTLADRLTEQARDGWSVVAIVPTGSSVTAYLSRASDTTDAGPAAAAAAATSEPVTGESTSGPDDDSDASTSTDGHDDSSEDGHDDSSEDSHDAGTEATEDASPASDATEEAPGWAAGISTTAAATTATTEAAAAPPAEEPATAGTTTAASSATADTGSSATAAAGAAPAGWYADPSSRFELRYWDGSQWTEHVSRGGQQFTDPPVA